jgi:molecular chaperone GrpE
MTEKKKQTDEKLDIEELKQKCKEYLSGWQRAQADYINLEKEMERKRAEWIKMANTDLLMELLPVYDNLKLAMRHIPADKKESDWVVGIEHIKNQFKKFLEDMGIEEIVPHSGDKFDLDVHEAVKAEQENNNKIKKVLKHGYKLNGRVLYPAKVIV